jgi:hypothetical protein
MVYTIEKTMHTIKDDAYDIKTRSTIGMMTIYVNIR